MSRLGLFRRKGRERTIRADYRSRPKEEWTDDEVDHYLQTCSEEQYWAWWDAWSRETYEHPSIRSLRRSVLDLAREAAKASHPQEFGAMLRVEKGTITELIVIPIVQGDAHTILFTHTLPVDRSIKGTLHSHPDPHPYPSDADFEFFEAQGAIHLILGHPYGPDDWRAYDHTGLPTWLEVVDG